MFVRTGRILILTAALCLLSLLKVGRNPASGFAEDSVRLPGNHSAQAEVFTPLGDAAPDAPLHMQLRFALHNQAALEQLIADQQNPTSKHFHKWLKTGEFGHRFGPSTAEVKAAEQWLKSNGFTITTRAPSYLGFSGSVAQAQHAFEVRIARFGDGTRYANTSDPVVPRNLAGVIGAISGMDNMTRAVPQYRSRLRGATSNPSSSSSIRSGTNGLTTAPQTIIGGVTAFGPGDVRSFYDQTVAGGRDGTINNDCIAIIGTSEFSDATTGAFISTFGLPPVTLTRALHGANPGIDPTDKIEAELDIQWAHAAAPGAALVYHYGSDLVDSISHAVSDNACGAINISFALCGPSQALVTGTLHSIFLQAAAQGQSVFVSSGDDGSAGLAASNDVCIDSFVRSVNEMSADPNVTSVGGTEFTPRILSGNNVGNVPEEAWDDASGATGGGASQFFPKPSYQTGAGVPNDFARDVPDISLIASPNSPGVFWADQTSGGAQVICCIGGTSLSAPLWAAYSRVIAQLSGNRRLGNLNPMIYDLANQQSTFNFLGIRDVSSGENSENGVAGFPAGAGYDQSTGWGTVDFDKFATAATSWIASHPTSTSGATPTATATPTITVTATPTTTPTTTRTATITPTATITATRTVTATLTPTATVTSTTTATVTLTTTATPTITRTATVTLTPTATLTTTPTPGASTTPSLTPTSAPTPSTPPTATPTVITSATGTTTIAPTPTPTPSAEPTGGVLAVPAMVHFPATGVGLPGVARPLIIRNRSKTTALSVDVGNLGAPYTVEGAGHYSIGPGSNITVMIDLDPSAVGVVTSALPIVSGDPKHPQASVAVKSKVLAGRLSAPHRVTFATRAGTSASKTVNLKNVGRGMISGTVEQFPAGSSFELVGAPISFTLAPGEKLPVTINFSGASAGKAVANLAIDTQPPPATTNVVVTGAAR